MHTFRILFAPAFIAAAPALLAQGTPFQTPGMPQSPGGTPPPQGIEGSQATRFSSVFNPAFSFVIDAVADYVSTDDEEANGIDARIAIVEFGAQAWVDPNAWAYFIAAAEEEELGVEEGAIHFVDLGWNSTLRAGRFFIDFGKQMQAHAHELRTTDRPLVLRAYLGPEVKGDGLQWDSWTSVGESGAVRWSLAAFSNLFPEEQDFVDEAFERSVDERKDLGDLNFTARLTGFHDVGQRGVIQIGASLRSIPEYAVEEAVNGLTAEDLESEVVGVDATYGWTSDTGLQRWTFGTEALWSRGDTGFSVIDPDGTSGTGDESLDVQDDSLFGGYVFGDYAWNTNYSAGVQYSQAEIAADLDATEVEVYCTRMFSEFHRLRFTIAQAEVDGAEDETRFLVQYTAFAGAHGHGINW